MIRNRTTLITAILLIAGFSLAAFYVVNSDGKFSESISSVTAKAGIGKKTNTEGYILFAPMLGKRSFLLDSDQKVVKVWRTQLPPGRSVELSEDGTLLHPSRDGVSDKFRKAAGVGGRVTTVDLDEKVVWSYIYRGPNHAGHHDADLLPNGNILMLGYEWISYDDAIALGRDPRNLRKSGLFVDSIVEVEPTGRNEGKVVWKWCAIDHIIQNRNPKLPNYAAPADQPNKIDFNYGRRVDAGWLHLNSVDFHPERNEIMVSSHTLGEIWIIDRSAPQAKFKAGESSEEELRSTSDLVFRWGNPEVYGGDPSERKLYGQHDARWIDPGYPGEGHITVFNNGWGQPGEEFSTVVEIDPSDGNSFYAEPGGGAKGIVWSYGEKPEQRFFSQRISGAKRLPSGNTLICDGAGGELFEVTPEGGVRWRYTNKFGPPRKPESEKKTEEKIRESRENSESEKSPAEPFRRTVIFKAEWYPSDHPGIRAVLEHPET